MYKLRTPPENFWKYATDIYKCFVHSKFKLASRTSNKIPIRLKYLGILYDKEIFNLLQV